MNKHTAGYRCRVTVVTGAGMAQPGFSGAVRGAAAPPACGRQCRETDPGTGVDSFMMAVGGDIDTILDVPDGFAGSTAAGASGFSQPVEARGQPVPIQPQNSALLRVPPQRLRAAGQAASFGVQRLSGGADESLDPSADSAATFLEHTARPDEQARERRRDKDAILSAEVTNSIEELKGALERMKKKLERSRQHEAALGDELRNKAETLDAMRQEARQAEVERIKALERAAEKTKRAKAKKRAKRRGVVASVENLDDDASSTFGAAEGDDEEYDAGRGGEEAAERTGCTACLHALRLAPRRAWRTCGRGALACAVSESFGYVALRSPGSNLASARASPCTSATRSTL